MKLPSFPTKGQLGNQAIPTSWCPKDAPGYHQCFGCFGGRYGCFQKSWYPKMDGLFHGKPYEKMDDLGGNTPIFGLTPIYFVLLYHLMSLHFLWPLLPLPVPWLLPSWRFVFFGFKNADPSCVHPTCQSKETSLHTIFNGKSEWNHHQAYSSWWFQPVWKILVKLDHVLKEGWT